MSISRFFNKDTMTSSIGLCREILESQWDATLDGYLELLFLNQDLYWVGSLCFCRKTTAMVIATGRRRSTGN